MIVRLVADRDQFAAERRNILDRSDRTIAPAVEQGLRRYPADGWERPVVQAALGVWEQMARAEYPQDSPVLDDRRDRFRTVLTAALGRTQADPDREAQAQRITQWLSTWAVNDGTASAAMADTGEALTLEWVSMQDTVVRETHRAADGQRVPVGGTFDVGGYDLHMPGEPVGPPSVWINCRCVVRIGMGGTMSMETVTASEEADLAARLDASRAEGIEAIVASLTAAAEADEVDEDAPGLPDDFDMGPTPWHSVFTVEGIQTGDRRKFVEEGLEFADVPFPIRWQKVDMPGHDGSVVVGRTDRIWREGNLIKAEGIFHNSPEAIEVMGLIGERFVNGISVDVDSAEVELQKEDGSPFSWEEEEESGERPIEVIKGRVRSAAICSIPAFAEAFIALGPWGDSPLGEAEEDSLAASAEVELAPGTRDGPGWITHPRATQRITNYWVKGPGAAKIGWGMPNDFYRCRRQLAKYVQNPEWLDGLCANLHKRALGIWPGEHTAEQVVETGGDLANFECTDCLDALVASAKPVPSAWFENPNLPGPTPLTVTEEGRVFGHAAAWGTCHIGQPGSCITPPHSVTDYASFHLKAFPTDEGMVPCGTLTVGTGHASLRDSAAEAMAHYDNTGTAAAFVRMGEDDHGIWFAGVMSPYATDEQRFALQTAAISGDWRGIGYGLEMVAALAVNVPGFPIQRPALAASGLVQTALVASMVVTVEHEPTVDPERTGRVASARRQARARLVKAGL